MYKYIYIYIFICVCLYMCTYIYIPGQRLFTSGEVRLCRAPLPKGDT